MNTRLIPGTSFLRYLLFILFLPLFVELVWPDRVQERYVATTVCIYPVYTLIAFGQRCRDAGVRPSMGSVGDCFDNAVCESFFATLECELLDRRHIKTQIEARSSRVVGH